MNSTPRKDGTQYKSSPQLANPKADKGSFDDRWRDALRQKEEERLAQEHAEKMAAQAEMKEPSPKDVRDALKPKLNPKSPFRLGSPQTFAEKQQAKKEAEQSQQSHMPPSARLPRIGDDSRMSAGAQDALGKHYNWRAVQDDAVWGSPERRARRLAEVRRRHHPVIPHILQEDESGVLVDQDGEAPPWAGWAQQKPEKGKRSWVDWRGWGSQTREQAREMAMNRAAGSALDVKKTTRIVHI